MTNQPLTDDQIKKAIDTMTGIEYEPNKIAGVDELFEMHEHSFGDNKPYMKLKDDEFIPHNGVEFNQPWQEEFDKIYYNHEFYEKGETRSKIIDFISELLQENIEHCGEKDCPECNLKAFTAGYKAGRYGRNKDVLDLIERVIQEERFAGAPYALNKIKELINKDERSDNPLGAIKC